MGAQRRTSERSPKVTKRAQANRAAPQHDNELAAAFRSIPALKTPMTDSQMTELAAEENAREVVRRLNSR
jgi:hypothetical protein